MADREDDVYIFILGMVVGAALVFAVAALVPTNRWARAEGERWRAWSCQRQGATVANDTLCVRPDSSWRVEEPPRG